MTCNRLSWNSDNLSLSGTGQGLSSRSSSDKFLKPKIVFIWKDTLTVVGSEGTVSKFTNALR